MVDDNGNGLSDVWEMVNDADGLSGALDSDHDGATDAQEAEAGTHPLNPHSRFSVGMNGDEVSWMAQPGKLYSVERSQDLTAVTWETVGTFVGLGYTQSFIDEQAEGTWFYRIVALDTDTDADGVNDWEEMQVGYDPNSAYSLRLPQTDLQRLTTALGTANQVSVAAIDPVTSESWPDPAVFVLRRSGGVNAFNASVALTGTAVQGSDYAAVTLPVAFAPGQIEAYVYITPLEDAAVEGDETVILTLQSSADYSIGTDTDTVTIQDASYLPTAKEAARFLSQATFGPTPELIAEVQSMGIEAWIDDQFTQPVGELQPVLDAIDWGEGEGQIAGPYNHHKLLAWWEQAMRGPDPLRQRVGFAMSEIFVVSDNSVEIPRGVLNYYDMLLNNAFGNYRELIEDITYHPVMGVYLSHRGNQPPDPALNRFPDENYAREIMQLFSIGLWMLNNDGTQQLDGLGNPIATYDNDDITNLARVFTGMSWGYGNTSVWWEFFWPDTTADYTEYYLIPMAVWNGPYSVWVETEPDVWEETTVYYHDQDAKTVLGVDLPANDPLSPEPGYAVNDIDRALDVLFNHQNTAPFIAHALIQRMVTSNPSPAYVARVAEAFNGGGPYNPGGIRGDMKAVIKAIFLDPEARSLDSQDTATFGKLRVPYLRYIAFSRAFNALPGEGSVYGSLYEVLWIGGDLGMQPMSSPSVFNFYQPYYQPPGTIKDLGLTGPEFQITNAVTGITLPNLFFSSVFWGYPGPNVEIDISPITAMAGDIDAMLDYLDSLLTYGSLGESTRQTVYYALTRSDTAYIDNQQRAQLAIFLIVTSPDFAVIR